MRVTTHNFQVIKAGASYTCRCGKCGKPLKRKTVVEHTVNPFNKNEDGTVRTAREVYQCAQAEANKKAAELQDVNDICKDCEDEPNRALLLDMAANPLGIYPGPERYWNSPMHVLVERKQAEAVYENCACGADCCSGWKRSPGYRLTAYGLRRVEKIKARWR